MAIWRWIGVLSVVLWGTGLIAPGNLYAAGDGYTLDDLQLKSAGNLRDVCAIDPGHEQHTDALAFCYGFFEGAIRYTQAIAGSDPRRKLVCEPPGTTRLQAVEVFTRYMNEHPEYDSEGPIDALFRALIARWPCPQAS